jgi:hypothetical protein
MKGQKELGSGLNIEIRSFAEAEDITGADAGFDLSGIET